MFYARFKVNGITEEYIYHSWLAFYSDTFNPETVIEAIIEFKVKGKSYAERKSNLENIAIDWSYEVGNTALSVGEYGSICNWFEKTGKRYGLLTEFKENCIC